MNAAILTLAAALALVACGGDDGAPFEQPWSPSGGSEASAGSGAAGTHDPGAGGTKQTATAGSAGDTLAGSGGTDGLAGTGGAPASGGQLGGSAGEQTQAGTAGTTTGGSSAGASQGGGAGGGSEPDSLAPKPAENCPGYVDILVPLNTCLWFHGEPDRSFQSASCDVIDPPASSGCRTVTATQKDITSRVSAGANFERFDVDPTTGLCPHLCN